MKNKKKKKKKEKRSVTNRWVNYATRTGTQQAVLPFE